MWNFRLDLESILSDKENDVPEARTNLIDFERILAANAAANNTNDDDKESCDGSFAKPSLLDLGPGLHRHHLVC